MIFRRAVSSSLALTIILAMAVPVHAVVIAEESFDYQAGTALKGANGGKGWDGAWFISPRNNADNQVVAGSLTFGGLAGGGNKMKQIGGDVRSFRKIDTSRKEVAP